MKNLNAERDNPCFKEQQLTYKCFDENNYVKEACMKHMENYQACKAFWGSVRSDRRRKGLYPLLPPLEERERIKEEYMRQKRS